MSALNFKFQAKHGNAIIAKDDVICIEDIDNYSCAISIRMPNNEIHKIYSVERAEELYERMQNIKVVTPNFVERRRTLEATSNDDAKVKRA
ncbi:MAG: hypothetical protein P8J14_13225 [Emcibacteraceae bacterium]|nr:hypothetical protein [Emcibacteraceae bacterium]